MNVWKLMLHHEKDEEGNVIDPELRQKMLDWSYKKGCIALGWGKIDNISKYVSQEKIAEAIGCCYSTGPHNRNHGAYSLWNFCHVMQEGDRVIIVGKNSRREAIMRVDGDYDWRPEEEDYPVHDYQHQRKATKVGGQEQADKEWNRWKQAGSKLEGSPYSASTRLIFPE